MVSFFCYLVLHQSVLVRVVQRSIVSVLYLQCVHRNIFIRVGGVGGWVWVWVWFWSLLLVGNRAPRLSRCRACLGCNAAVWDMPVAPSSESGLDGQDGKYGVWLVYIKAGQQARTQIVFGRVMRLVATDEQPRALHDISPETHSHV